MNVAQDIFVRPPLLCVPKLLVRAHEVIGRADVRYWPLADIPFAQVDVRFWG